MRVPIIDIGNSKGIRIPQAILKQVQFGQDIELDVADGKITLKRCAGASSAPDFARLPQMDDESIQRILRGVPGVDLMTALVGAGRDIKEAVYRNLSPRVKEYLMPTVERLEKGDAKDLLIERSRNIICESMVAQSRE